MGPHAGWLGGWGIIVADIIVMANLAYIAGQYTFLLFGLEEQADDTFWRTSHRRLRRLRLRKGSAFASGGPRGAAPCRGGGRVRGRHARPTRRRDDGLPARSGAARVQDLEEVSRIVGGRAPVTTAVDDGSPEDVLVEAAERHDAQMIVLAPTASARSSASPSAPRRTASSTGAPCRCSWSPTRSSRP
jgi:hypothetical protein